MDFEFSEEQTQLAESLRKYLASEYDFEKRKTIVKSASGVSDTVWATFADMGLIALALPEADGGFGGGAVGLMATMEACGEALVVEPLLDNVGLAARLVSRGGSTAQREALLPGLVDGRHRLAFAYLEPGRRYELDAQKTTAKAQTGGWVLDGEKSVVIGAPSARVLIVSAHTAGVAGQPDGTSLFLVDADAPGVSINADAIGTMKNANDATLEYLKNRKQFGAPIGSFQALQHRMVDMYVVCEQARSMAIFAAAKVDEGGDAGARKRAISAAKVKIADAARQVSQESVQLHGGMGMTEELKVSHNFRRLTMIAQRFGDADHHLERYATFD